MLQLRDRAAKASVPLIEKPLLTDTLFQGIRTALGRHARVIEQPNVVSPTRDLRGRQLSLRIGP
jgi:hypothetical protein